MEVQLWIDLGTQLEVFWSNTVSPKASSSVVDKCTSRYVCSRYACFPPQHLFLLCLITQPQCPIPHPPLLFILMVWVSLTLWLIHTSISVPIPLVTMWLSLRKREAHPGLLFSCWKRWISSLYPSFFVFFSWNCFTGLAPWGENPSENKVNTWRGAGLGGEKQNSFLRVLTLSFKPLYQIVKLHLKLDLFMDYLVRYAGHFLFFLSQFNVSSPCTMDGILDDIWRLDFGWTVNLEIFSSLESHFPIPALLFHVFVLMAPRHLRSLLTTQSLPAWWSHRPALSDNAEVSRPYWSFFPITGYIY